MADPLIMIDRGRLIADMTLSDFESHWAGPTVTVCSRQAEASAGLLMGSGATVAAAADGTMAVAGLSPERFGDLAGDDGIRLHEIPTGGRRAGGGVPRGDDRGAGAPAHGGEPPMRGALDQEWIRIRTLRSTWRLSGSAIVAPVLLAAAFILTAGAPRAARAGMPGEAGVLGDQEAFCTVLASSTLLMGLMGVLAFGRDYWYATILRALTSVPRRTQVAAARVLGIALWSRSSAARPAPGRPERAAGAA